MQQHSNPMGICCSCIRLMLDGESDVKVHVIEPTSIGVEHSAAAPATVQYRHVERSGLTLQVPEMHRVHRNLL
ncbi:hypothetical protein DICVIV_06783 [Dictyocaulus viviparus]|uniref:Uncharacterized protein n=1 Tax=Dictyocaulus viviparus TaxID=29172 RepID=A0A0D8XTH7_DICVI|nr:hypothetical protein DICVIV_06783 [Dictyocaulus viviparus]